MVGCTKKSNFQDADCTVRSVKHTPALLLSESIFSASATIVLPITTPSMYIIELSGVMMIFEECRSMLLEKMDVEILPLSGEGGCCIPYALQALTRSLLTAVHVHLHGHRASRCILYARPRIVLELIMMNSLCSRRSNTVVFFPMGCLLSVTPGCFCGACQGLGKIGR